MRQTVSFALGGGLDEETQPLAIEPGRVIAAVNHEVIDEGYARIDGYERYDGRVGPTDFPFYTLSFTDGSVLIPQGATVIGQNSGATGIVLVDATLDDGAWDGSGVGIVGLRDVTGTFAFNENLLVGGVPRAIAAASQVLAQAGSGEVVSDAIALAARNYARALIGAVPGSGPVRGVWQFESVVYAFRDNADATAGVMHKSSSTGWQAVALGHTLDFTSGGTVPINEGDTITGATSGATAKVERLVISDGDWATGDVSGYLVLSNIAGTFGAENVNVGASLNVATISGPPVATTLPPGGRYFFTSHNFYGASALRRVYGCNGVGRGFEFSSTVFVPIRTGMADDKPNRVAVFRNQLFFAFSGGSVQHSAPADPIAWDPVVGAAEIMIGSDVADFIPNVDALIILGTHGIFSLTGYDVQDWLLGDITREAGALPYTAQRFGPGIYLDNRGLRSITATSDYGNFEMGTLSRFVGKTLRRKLDAGVRPTGSAIIRSKDQYRLFYQDGTGLTFYMGRKFPEAMPFDLGKVVRCISSHESEDGQIGSERVFFGSDDGFVYQLDKGTSFDGASIEAFMQLAYANMGSPNHVKRLHKVSFEVNADAASEIAVTVEFDYSSNEQPGGSQSTVKMAGAGGLWNVADWNQFYWSSPTENVLEIYVDGQGRNASCVLYSDNASIAPYLLRGVTLFFNLRGAIR